MVRDWKKYKETSPYKDEIEVIINDIISNNISGYRTEKLKGTKTLYKIRKGKIRIIFMKSEQGNEVVKINSRGDVYKGI